MKSKITKEEFDAITNLKNEQNIKMNQLFVEHAENDILSSMQNEFIPYQKEDLIQTIDQIKKIYTTMIKNYDSSEKNKNITLYKGTNLAEIDKLKINSIIHPFLVVKSNQKKAESELSNHWNRPVILKINRNENLPFLKLDKDETLITPFTVVKNLKEEISENTDFKVYEIELQPQELEHLSEEEANILYNTILEKVDQINEKLTACVAFDNENATHYENIRKLEQLLANHHFAMEQENYEQDTTEAEKQSDLDDIARINLELTSLRENTTKIFNLRKENSDEIADWKKDIITYLKNELRKINEECLLEDKEEKSEKTENECITKEIKKLDPAVESVKKEALENIAVVHTLLENIKNLISKQQNHARIAESMDSNYKALNNAFEMKNQAEELDALLQSISNKIDIVSPENKEELAKISETNIQISILLNYLNNAKAAVSKKISRFDEISIIEENELKKEIAETIKNIRCEAELKKLRDDVEIIQDKSSFRKFVGRFTGRNKLDRTMLSQIQIRQTAIRKTFKTKMPLSYNYSIHELIAEIEIFIKENDDDELILEDISQLRKIKEALKKNFVIIDSKVMSIIDKKNGKNLPVEAKKISKTELIEIDTYRFLNRYGYDKSNDIQEPEYQDTLAGEIKRIVDYIKTSGIL